MWVFCKNGCEKKKKKVFSVKIGVYNTQTDMVALRAMSTLDTHLHTKYTRSPVTTLIQKLVYIMCVRASTAV